MPNQRYRPPRFAIALAGYTVLLCSLLHSPSGLAQTYFYDAGSRLIKVAYAAGDGIRYRYDSSDNLTSVAHITLPAAPSALTAGPGNGCITLNWRDNAANETGFVVMRRPADDVEWQDIATPDRNATRYTDCPPAGSYVYRVAGDSAEGLSAFSNEQTATAGGGAGGEIFSNDFETP